MVVSVFRPDRFLIAFEQEHARPAKGSINVIWTAATGRFQVTFACPGKPGRNVGEMVRPRAQRVWRAPRKRFTQRIHRSCGLPRLPQIKDRPAPRFYLICGIFWRSERRTLADDQQPCGFRQLGLVLVEAQKCIASRFERNGHMQPIKRAGILVKQPRSRLLAGSHHGFFQSRQKIAVD